MPDVLIRNVSVDDLAMIDAQAARAGLSRTEYLRRQLRQVAGRREAPITVEQLQTFTQRFGDLADPEVMRHAWS